jgi:RES domain
MNPLQQIVPPERIFRIGRSPDPWDWPPWSAAGTGGTFDNRWDDSKGVYRVSYAASTLHGAFVEVLSRFRPDAVLIAGLSEIEAYTAADQASIPAGVVPREWRDQRAIGMGSVSGVFVDIGHADSLTYLHTHLAARLVHYNISELDGAAIRRTAPRTFTQEVSSFIFEQADGKGTPSFAGLSYLSRFGDNFRNWAIFERAGAVAPVVNPTIRPIRRDDPDFLAALATLGLTLGP